MEDLKERLELLRATVREAEPRVVIHAMPGPGLNSPPICGQWTGKWYNGQAWRDAVETGLLPVCPDCVELWNALTPAERRVLGV